MMESNDLNFYTTWPKLQTGPATSVTLNKAMGDEKAKTGAILSTSQFTVYSQRKGLNRKKARYGTAVKIKATDVSHESSRTVAAELQYYTVIR